MRIKNEWVKKIFPIVHEGAKKIAFIKPTLGLYWDRELFAYLDKEDTAYVFLDKPLGEDSELLIYKNGEYITTGITSVMQEGDEI